MNRTRGALVHRLMHISVEKHALRVRTSCGTLTVSQKLAVPGDEIGLLR